MTPSDAVAARVKAFRKRLNISAADLAERCVELGAEGFTADVIANIESGRRDASKRRKRNVTVDELLILAAALDVPPILLLFPVGAATEIEVLPGRKTDATMAWNWFTGRIATPPAGREKVDLPIERLHDWRAHRQPLAMYDQHELSLGDVIRFRRNMERYLRMADNATSPDIRDRFRGDAREAELDLLEAELALRTHRATMRQQGYMPPDLAPEIMARIGESNEEADK